MLWRLALPDWDHWNHSVVSTIESRLVGRTHQPTQPYLLPPAGEPDVDNGSAPTIRSRRRLALCHSNVRTPGSTYTYNPEAWPTFDLPLLPAMQRPRCQTGCGFQSYPFAVDCEPYAGHA